MSCVREGEAGRRYHQGMNTEKQPVHGKALLEEAAAAVMTAGVVK